MVNGFKSIMLALVLFISGVLFAYATWPFFTALLTALDGAGESFADWEYIKGIAWIGMLGFYLTWIVILPYYHAVVKQEEG